MACKGILVVEDDEDIRRQVVLALESENYRVISAENGQKALDFLLGAKPEELPGCMILDLMMPEMDGKTLMEEIEKNHPQFLNIKILIATAKGSVSNPQKYPRAATRIQKPFDLEKLYREVEKHCGKPA